MLLGSSQQARKTFGWSSVRLGIMVGLSLLAMLASYRAWVDIFYIAWKDEEASQVWLVPLVVAWLVWARWEAVKRTRPTYTWYGPAVAVAGIFLHILGFSTNTQVFWHGGAVLMLAGAWVTVMGPALCWRLLPALLVLVFLVPVPGTIRLEMAMPLQNFTARASQFLFEVMGLDVRRSGNQLIYNGQTALIAEACNGMRMMFALILVAYAFVFGMPLRTSVRVVLLVLSPVAAVLCNILRVVPTVVIHGHYPDTFGKTFHDLAGWGMLVLSFLMLAGFIRLLRWAEVPVMQNRAALVNA
jgi:exosortase